MQTTATPGITDNGIPTTQRPEHKVAAHIRDAAETTGVPFDFLLAQANQESRLNPDAKNRRSSAQGLFQFTSGTWVDMVKRHGAEHGLEKYADAITRGADGRWTVKDKELRKEILELRRDPKISALMAAEYAKDNERILEAKLGRQVSTQDLYLAHFLGAGGALKVLKGRGEPESDQQPAALAGAAQANPEFFHDPASGEQHSLDAVYANVGKRFRRAMSEAAYLASQLHPQVDLAQLRPEMRPEEILPVEAPPVQEVALNTAEPAPTVGSFPARLPPRPPNAPPRPAALEGQPYPVALPPPVTGARADAGTLRGLMVMQEDKG